MEQETRPKAGEIERLSGTWETEGWQILIKPCWSISRKSQGVKYDTCAYPPETLAGTVMLWIDTDNGFAYKKVTGD